MKLVPRKQTHRDATIGRGMDMALMTLLFLGVGYVLDRVFDTKPVLMITLVVLAIAGEIARFYYAYAEQMKHHEAERAAAAMGKP